MTEAPTVAAKELKILPLRDTLLLPGTVGSLVAGRESSLAAIHAAVDAEEDIFLLAQQSADIEAPLEADLFKTGVVARILQVLKLPGDTLKILVEAKYRATYDQCNQGAYLTATVHPVKDLESDVDLLKRYRTLLTHRFNEYTELNQTAHSDAVILLKSIENLSLYVDMMAAHILNTVSEKQKIVEMSSLKDRLKYMITVLSQEIEWLNVEHELRHTVKADIESDQTAYVKEKRLKAIQKLLNQDDNTAQNDLKQLRASIEGLPLDSVTRDKLLSECDKLKQMPAASSEASVIRAHLDWVVEVPWTERSAVNLDLENAQQALDQDHYGLQKVKDRILEHIAVQVKCQGNVKGPILCLVGPPGVGKTSLGQSIAQAMGREFIRIALGGVRDEAEIRGHRKTYIGAMPGRIIKAMKRVGVINPVILLDEIDKIGMDFRGDPASALLEVLDPEQNTQFNDHYLEVDYNLSEAIFITTANTTEIPAALKDRMEMICLSSYTEAEKLNIAEHFLLPKCIKQAGLADHEIKVSKPALQAIIRSYTREAGVRDIERLISTICRKVTQKTLSPQSKSSYAVSARQLQHYLGPPRYERDQALEMDHIGLVHGMAWTSVGGALLTIEATLFPGKGLFECTGHLGNVMKESMKTALSLIRTRAEHLGIAAKHFKTFDMHVHVPEGATPKDGPSAGIAICTALTSVMTGRAVKQGIVMTGEVTLRGAVLKIGGLKEKLLAAIQSGATVAIIPKANEPDLVELIDILKNRIKVLTVDHIDEVLEVALVPESSSKVVND